MTDADWGVRIHCHSLRHIETDNLVNIRCFDCSIPLSLDAV